MVRRRTTPPLIPASASGPFSDTLSEIVGANIRFEAARYGFSQQDLADYLRRSRSAVSQRFNGRVAWSLDDVGRISFGMGVKPGYLLQDPVPAAWDLSGY